MVWQNRRMAERSTDVVVIGAGAAGLMCAIEAGKRGRRVVVLEHNQQIGRKILISGGGRCNFTNLHTRPESFLSANPHFAKSALARYGPDDFLALVRRHRVPYHEKTLGQLFCDGSAREIISLLESECAAAGVRCQTGCTVLNVEQSAGFRIETNQGTFQAASMVVATGGLSIPKIGATSFGYDLARRFGLAVWACRPALVPLTFARQQQTEYADLAGVSLEVTAQYGRAAFREKMLFTHRGVSGPAILQVSSYWEPGRELEIDLMPGCDVARLLTEQRAAADRSEAHTILGTALPKRLAKRWLELRGVSRPVVSLSDSEIQALSRDLHAWRFVPAGTEGFEKAEVTAGGLDTAEISSKTFEAKKVPGLYFVGEVLDVTGQLGGFNFQWAWASGYAAGQFV
jgi:predicted Rossmann fold flavoprotein